ncbi:hypothetical protein JCGZ_20972 [Jatropha curcas]|uniref:FBD domain-containing protein n=1 Tax=Jatropha curcas TaxID=180498 RepID=A0A067JT17_JATCU|nr:hypothetical protein JCGZ_20972 [Jatropha curcas]
MEIDHWIFFAITHKVEELDLHFPKCTVVLPATAFRSETLRILKLHGLISFQINGSDIDLPNLKILHLNSILLLSHFIISKFLSGSPVLEELLISTHCSHMSSYFYLQSSSLKRLILEICCNIVVDTPNLQFLELHDQIWKEIKFKKLCSLVKAIVDVSQCYDNTIKELGEYGDKVFRLFRQLSNVKTLSLSANTMEALFCPSSEDLPLFHNLNYLEVTVSGNGWIMLPHILECSPNLKFVTINKDDEDPGSEIVPHEVIVWSENVPNCLFSSLEILEFKRFEGSTVEMEVIEYFLKYGQDDEDLESEIVLDDAIFGQQPLPQCFFSSLENLEIRGFQGSVMEMEVAGCFLKNAKVLKEIRITSSAASFEEESKFLKKLIMFPRASSMCQVIFS